LNDTLDFNPTAENIARWICDNINNCYRVEVQESEGNIAAYEKDV
jgi:6-pyruvoyltetrahydropterin/6-carboxytetrahydropterin synthase